MCGLEIDKIEATKPNTTEAQITITITNPQEVEITGITIEDMEVASITRNVTQNGVTSITVRATPNRYYDSYKLTEIKYKTTNSDEEYTQEVEAEIEVQFYKEIYTYEDWQSIEEGTYQNYRLMADIDFSGKDTINSNITVNKLEAENNVYTLKNITLEFNGSSTGLISNVKTSIKNIGFENITLTNTASSGNYFGVIASNTGDIENLKFNNITINATGTSYVGVIGYMASGNITNVELNTIDVKGTSYVGGLIGNVNVQSEAEISNITGNEINIEALGDYVGGIIGYQKVNYMQVTEILIQNSNITGNYHTGGIIGYAYNADLTYLTANSINVTGDSYVGGIVGYNNDASTNGDYKFQCISINDSIIIGNGSYIGGVNGFQTHRSSNRWSLNNIKIQAPNVNSQYIGGAVGQTSWSYLHRVQIEGLEIDSNGTNVGGIIGGNLSNQANGLYNSYINNGLIKGSSNVGGIIGCSQYSQIQYTYANVEVEATNHTAGGIVGYMDNTNMTGSIYYTRIYYTMLLDSTVTAPTKAGGLIGDIATEIYRATSYYYNNYIDADVTSQDESTGSLIIGSRPDENDYITNTYVYKYSTLNGDYVYQTDDNIDESQYLVRSDLESQSTYTGKIGLGTTTYWSYTKLSEGKYPTIADSYLYYPELQEGVDLPTDPEISGLSVLSITNDEDESDTSETNDESDVNTAEETQNTEELPEITVYPSSVNEINIDFSDVIDGISFMYYVNGELMDVTEETSESIMLTQKTYTFKYNYQDEIQIIVTDGTNEKTTTILPEHVQSKISLVGETNAYLNGNTLYINGTVQVGEYVNVYNGYALNTEGQVLELASGSIVENTTQTLIEENVTPLHTYNYNGYTIETYGTYSTVNGNIKLQIYNVQNGKLSVISNTVDMKIDNYISDNYNNNEYQTILSTDGELVSLKAELNYPENFLSRNIEQIVQNSDQEKTEVMVIYNTGKVIVFNYVTGDIVYDNEEKAEQGLLSYILGNISEIFDDYEERQEAYEASQELISKLKEMPLDEVLEETQENISIQESEDTNTETSETQENTQSQGQSSTTYNTNNIGNNYITVYNSQTGEYEVYSENEILESEEEEPTSETAKIKANGLENAYSYTETENQTIENGFAMIVGVIVASIVSLVILRRLVYTAIARKREKYTDKKISRK